VTRRPRAGIALAALLASLAAAGLPAAADPRLVVDAAGRRVAVPATVTRVFAAGGPASIFLYIASSGSAGSGGSCIRRCSPRI
jgi:ABC-type Fe3+-hydroxamate transport system substrate-binding protein